MGILNDWFYMAGPMICKHNTNKGKNGDKGLIYWGSQWRRQTIVVICRKMRKEWLRHCSLSYDQARSIQPPFVECYPIASKVDPQLMSKEKDLIIMKKIFTVVQFFLSRRFKWPFGLRPGSRDTPYVSHLFTKSQNCLWPLSTSTISNRWGSMGAV